MRSEMFAVGQLWPSDDDDNDDEVSSLIQRIFAAPVLCRVLTGAISRTIGVKPHKKAHKNRPSYSELNSVINLFNLTFHCKELSKSSFHSAIIGYFWQIKFPGPTALR